MHSIIPSSSKSSLRPHGDTCPTPYSKVCWVIPDPLHLHLQPCIWKVSSEQSHLLKLLLLRLLQFASTWSLALLLLICPTSLRCISHHALSAPLLTLTSSVFQTDVKGFKDSAPFLSLVFPSGKISLSLCDMHKLCLPSNLSGRHLFSISYSYWFKLSRTCFEKCVCV